MTEYNKDGRHHPVTTIFRDDRDVVNDIWAIDQIQTRVQSQHVHAQSQSPMSTQMQAQRVASQSYQALFPSPAETEALSLDGLWKDLVNAAAGTSAGGVETEGMTSGDQDLGYLDDGVQWDQLFADLDYFVGPS